MHAEACFAANCSGALALAEQCAKRGISTVSFSSDLVFDGLGTVPYIEADRTSPINVYGESKAALETALAGLSGRHLVVRTAAFFSPFDEHNFAVACLGALRSGKPFAAAADCFVSPTYVPDLCRHVLDLVIDRADGVWHLTNGESVSWHGFARRLAVAAGLDRSLVTPGDPHALGWTAVRPLRVPLASTRGALMPSLSGAIERFVAGYRARNPAPVDASPSVPPIRSRAFA